MGTNQSLARLGAVAAFVGTVVLFGFTLLHPHDSNPNDAPAAFAEYAADSLWIWSHLGQFTGLAVLGRRRSAAGGRWRGPQGHGRSLGGVNRRCACAQLRGRICGAPD